MTDSLLENIIELEKQIQVELADEQARAAAWQTREVSVLQDSLSTARTAEERRRHQRLAELQADLKREGAVMEAASAAWCQRLASLDDAVLCSILQRHLAAILQGGDHDHPHGQG